MAQQKQDLEKELPKPEELRKYQEEIVYEKRENLMNELTKLKNEEQEKNSGSSIENGLDASDGRSATNSSAAVNTIIQRPAATSTPITTTTIIAALNSTSTNTTTTNLQPTTTTLQPTTSHCIKAIVPHTALHDANPSSTFATGKENLFTKTSAYPTTSQRELHYWVRLVKYIETSGKRARDQISYWYSTYKRDVSTHLENPSPSSTVKSRLENLLFNFTIGNKMMTVEEFMDKAIMLRQWFIEALTESSERYEVSDETLAEERLMISAGMYNIISESLGSDELLQYGGTTSLQDILTEARRQEQPDTKTNDCMSFLYGITLNFENIFMPGRVKYVQDGREKVIDIKELLNIAEKQFPVSQVLIVEGVPGSGKTALFSFLKMTDLEGGHYSFIGPNQYTSMQFISEETTEYRFSPFKQHCFLRLILVDCLGESSTSYVNFLSALSNPSHSNHCTFLCFTRPETVQDILKSEISRPTYGITKVQLAGIATDCRSEFVHRYIAEFMRVKMNGNGDAVTQTSTMETPSVTHIQKTYEITQAKSRTEQKTEASINIDTLMNIVEEEKDQNHNDIPLNLAIWASILVSNQHVKKKHLTQAELHKTAYKMYQEMKISNQTWPSHDLEEESSLNQLNLRPQDLGELLSMCKCFGLPADELIQDTLCKESMSTDGGNEEQYYVSWNNYRSTYQSHLMKIKLVQLMTKPRESKSKKVLLTLHIPENDVCQFQVLLKGMVSVFPRCIKDNPISAARQLIQHLKHTGIKSSNEWLEIAQTTNANTVVLQAIASFFPKNKMKILKVTDDQLIGFINLLPHLKARKLAVDIIGDPRHLLPSLETHTCTKLKLPFQFKHPKETEPAPDCTEKILSRSTCLHEYEGYICPGLQATNVSYLSIAVASDSQAELLCHLNDIKNLTWLKLHVTPDVNPDKLSQLPQIKYVILYLSDVENGGVERACKVVHKLHESDRGYVSIKFPRSNLLVEEWRIVVKLLGEARIKTEAVVFHKPLEIILTDQVKTDLINSFRNTLGCTFLAIDFADEGWVRRDDQQL